MIRDCVLVEAALAVVANLSVLQFALPHGTLLQVGRTALSGTARCAARPPTVRPQTEAEHLVAAVGVSSAF